MRRYLLQRAAGSAVALLLASLTVFAGIHALPGDPALSMSGQEGARDAELLAAIRTKYGLDRPLPVQYGTWLLLAAQGDFGQSIRTRVPVSEMIVQRLPITLQLAGWSMLVAVLIGVPAGILAATRRGRPADYAANAAALSGLSIPNFWLGLMLITVFAINLGWLPSSGFVAFADDPVENLRRMVLPAVVLGTGLAAVVMRQTRSSMIHTLSQDFVRTARSKGLSEPVVVLRHALRNSLITVVTIVGLQLGVLISGSVVTEQIFLIPGFGKLIIDAVFTRDYPVIQAVALVSAAAYIVLNFLVDLLYSLLNPRIRVADGPS